MKTKTEITHAEFVRRVNKGRNLPPALKKQSREAVAYANGNPIILSYLYDMDLMPEQLSEGSYRWGQMIGTISHFKAAIEAATNNRA